MSGKQISQSRAWSGGMPGIGRGDGGSREALWLRGSVGPWWKGGGKGGNRQEEQQLQLLWGAISDAEDEPEGNLAGRALIVVLKHSFTAYSTLQHSYWDPPPPPSSTSRTACNDHPIHPSRDIRPARLHAR